MIWTRVAARTTPCAYKYKAPSGRWAWCDAPSHWIGRRQDTKGRLIEFITYRCDTHIPQEARK